jgi:hypothetical protein
LRERVLLWEMTDRQSAWIPSFVMEVRRRFNEAEADHWESFATAAQVKLLVAARLPVSPVEHVAKGGHETRYSERRKQAMRIPENPLLRDHRAGVFIDWEITPLRSVRAPQPILGRQNARAAVGRVYRDHRISGARGRDKRPQFDAMHRDAARREFDVIMAWSVDRLGRSLQDLISFLSEVHAAGVDLYLHQQGLDTSTPAGKAMFQMLGVFAEFERALIRERVMAGLVRAVSMAP